MGLFLSVILYELKKTDVTEMKEKTNISFLLSQSVTFELIF
jgi:hypothetical protein